MNFSWVFHIDSVPMTAKVISGEASLGGSESACVGLARALKAQGHDVHIATTKLAEDAPEIDAGGVQWHRSEDLHHMLPIIDPDVFVALRSPHVFGLPVAARYRMLWNQDMLVGEQAKLLMMSYAWAYDELAYVSQYHRKQWEGVAPELKSIGWVTKNGYDPSLVPQNVTKIPNRIIHISRPERGLLPLLTMWPELKKRVPDAELQICRYQSMYDGEGSYVKAVCERYDLMVQAMNQKVGGIEYLGSLGKRELYERIAEASVMWYPGVVDFAETSCIAAIEAQACGTPFVGSYKGALPETVPSGFLVHGDAMSPDYQSRSLDYVEMILWGESGHGAVEDGHSHVRSYTYDAIATEWVNHLEETFTKRSANKRPIVEALLHEDDHVAALAITDDPLVKQECERVIQGLAQGPEAYANYALDPEQELTVLRHPRMDKVNEALEGCTSILDLACGNGAHAIALAEADPARHVHGIDYSKGNIVVARKAAERHKVIDRVSFACAPVCDMESGKLRWDMLIPTVEDMGKVDGVFLGEFCEHVAGVTQLLTDVSALVGNGVRVVVTVPSGPFSELLDPDTPKQKSHVHHFRPRDLDAIFGTQQDCSIEYLACGQTMRGVPVGHWIITFTTSDRPFGERPLEHWALTMRPQPKLSVGILAHNCTPDLARCLHDVFWIADEIILADCASGDVKELDRLADRYKARLLRLPHVGTLKGGFSEARNATLNAATGDWFLWIDADEQLAGNQWLWKYLHSTVYRGFAIKQNHLMLDAQQHFDTPIRCFKRGEDIQFYGCVHEQPQQGDCNGDIYPTLQLNDVQIAHTGYLHEGIRKQKASKRNLPLLVRDMEVFPDRRLGIVLRVRENVNQALWREEELGGQMDDFVRDCYAGSIALFEKHFMDPKDKFHQLARPFYEAALRRTNGAFEAFFAEGIAENGIKGRQVKPITWWIRKPEDRLPLIEHERAKLAAREAPLVLDVEPIEQPAGVAA